MRRTTLAAALLPLMMAAPQPGAQDAPPFGQPQDVEDARELWQAMATAELVGPDTIKTMPYQGADPHGAYLELLVQPVSIETRRAMAIVKKNYAGEDLGRAEVLEAPDEHLASVTVMFRREEGYDPENRNWFWAKYDPDGSLQTNEQGMPLAGRVAKGMEQGCIACHSGAPGDDYVFSYDLQQ